MTNTQLRTLAAALSRFLLFAALFTFVQFGTDALAGNDATTLSKWVGSSARKVSNQIFPGCPKLLLAPH